MVVKSNFKQKNCFCNCLSKLRCSFLKNLILASGIKRFNHYSTTFLPYFKNKKQQKVLIITFLLVRESLKSIANRSESIGIALISKSWMV